MTYPAYPAYLAYPAYPAYLAYPAYPSYPTYPARQAYTRARFLIRSRIRSGDRSGCAMASTGSRNVCSS